MVICKLAVRQMRKNTLIILIFTTENLMYNKLDTSYISFANRIGVQNMSSSGEVTVQIFCML